MWRFSLTAYDRRMKFANFVSGKWVPSESGATFENRNPANTTDLVGVFPDSTTNDATAAIAAAKLPTTRGGSCRRPSARRFCSRLRRSSPTRKEAVCPRHDARDGQGARRNARRRAGSDRHDVLPRRRGPATARTHRAVRDARQVRDVDAPADRRLLDDHAVEFPDGDPVVEDHSGARVRQHRGVEAVGAHAALRAQLRQGARGGRRSARRRQHGDGRSRRR